MDSVWIRRFFDPPVFEDEDKTRIANLLNIILLALLTGTAIFGLATLIIAPEQVLRLAIIGLMFLSELGVFFLMRRGHTRAASLLLSSLLWVIATLVVVAGGGVNAPGFSLYFISILISGLLLGGQSGFRFAGLSVLAGSGVFYAEISDILPAPLLIHTPGSVWIIESLGLILTAMLVYLATTSLNTALDRARKTQDQLIDAIESLTEAFALYDADDRLVLCNTKYREFYDLSADLLIPGTRFEDHIRASAHRGQIAEAIGREEAWVQGRVKQHQNPQGTYLQQLGNGRWLQISERKTSEGGIVGVRTDITDHKLAEQALQESEERYRTLMEQLPISIEIYNPDGTMIDANKAWERVWETKREVAVNRFNALNDPNIKELGMFQYIEKAFRGESGEIKEAFYVSPDDPSQKRWLHTRYYSLKDFSGNIANIVVLNEDITDRKQVEEVATRFGRILDASLNEIYIFDADTFHFIQVNRGAQENLGYSMTELRHLTPLNLKPEFTPESFAKLLEPLRTGQKKRIQFTTDHRRKDNSSYPVEVHLQYSTYESSPVFLAIILDITERKQAEEALERSEKHFRSLIENALDIITILNSDGTIRYESPSIERVLGYRPKELVGQNAFDFVHPDNLSDVMKAFTERSQVAGPAPPYEVRFRHKDNSWCVLEIIGTNLLDDPVVAGIVVNSRDITERKQAEEALKESETRFRATFEQAAVGIAHLKSDGRWLRVNQKLCDIVGYSREELLELTFHEITHPDDLETDLENVRRVLAGEIQMFSREKRYLHRDGTIVWVDVTVSLVHTLSDEPEYFISVIQDITDRKNLEEQYYQAQKMDAIGQLTAGVAHDFNNLLLVINGFAELVRQELAPDDPSQESIERILSSGQRATDLVHQLLAFSRKQIIEAQVLNLNATVTEMDKMLKRIIGENIELKTNLTPDLWKVKIDRAQIEQIIVNLAVNARDAMPEGGRLTIETSNVLLDDDYVVQHLGTQPGKHILLAISDTGYGMSEEVKARIFEPFYTTKEQGKGTGLGLATVYGIVKQNEGHIWVYSELEIGTTFKIYLPRTEEETASSTPRKEFVAEMPSGNETILLVEDDSEVRNLVCRILRPQGYTLLEAEEGRDALRLAAQHAGPIHLLLTDVIMPGMSGKLLAEELGQLRSDMKILFISGYTDDAIAHHGVLDPGINFLQKPFGPIDLARKVRDVLDS